MSSDNQKHEKGRSKDAGCALRGRYGCAGSVCVTGGGGVAVRQTHTQTMFVCRR